MKTIKIGLVGFGKIGSAVAGVIGSRRAYLRDKSVIDLKIISICDKDIKTKRAVKIDKKLLTRSIGRILYHPNIDIVIELIGGIHPAKDLVT